MAPVKLKYVVAFSSQDENHRANNLISSNGLKRWLCNPKDKSGKIEITIQLEQATQFTYIDIGTMWCASLEIRVGQSDWPQNAEYKTLVPMVTLMSPIDCQLGRKTTSTQMFSQKDFSSSTADSKWDRVQVICHQPYKKDMPLGISFIRLRNSDQNVDSSNLSKKNGACERNSPQGKKISEIQKHFFGESKENKGDETDHLKHRLLQISSSSDNPCDNLHQDALSRTAKLVLKASEKTHQSNAHYNQLSKQCKRGLFSDAVTNKTGMTVEEEITAFFPTLNLSIVDIDSVTIADLRHKFERKKKRKLSIDEKRQFSNICQEFILDLSEKDLTTPKNNSLSPGNFSSPSSKPVSKPSNDNSSKSLKQNVSKSTIQDSALSSPSAIKQKSNSNKNGPATVKLSPAAILRQKNKLVSKDDAMKCDREKPKGGKNDKKKKKKKSSVNECDDDFDSDICYDNSDDDDDDSDVIDDSSPSHKPQLKRRLQTLEDVNKSYQDLYKTFSPPEKTEHQNGVDHPTTKRKKLNHSSKKLIEMFDSELSDTEGEKSTSTHLTTWLSAKKSSTPNAQSKQNTFDKPSPKNRVVQNKASSSKTSGCWKPFSISSSSQKPQGKASSSCIGNQNVSEKNLNISSSISHQNRTPTVSSTAGSSTNTSSRICRCDFCGFLIPKETFAAHCSVCASSASHVGTKGKAVNRINTTQQVESNSSSVTDLTADSRKYSQCPICMTEFPQEIIAVHASECGL